MVVECPECGTRFSLEESRIIGATAKVRCSQCRQVFRINRAGQVVEPPAAPPAETPPSRKTWEETPVPPNPEAVEPPVALEGMEAGEEAALEAPEAAAPAEAPAAPKPRLRWWMVVLVIAVPILTALGWWLWRLQQSEPTAPGSQAGPAAPAPLVVTPSPPPVPPTDLREVPVDWAQARYEGLVNLQGQQLLVIRGEVANEGKTVRGPIRVKAILTDARHQPLKEEVVYAGTSLTDEELKTVDPKKIKYWLDRPGGRSQEQKLRPGEKQPFTVVFFGVPANLAETQAGFQLVVVEGPVLTDKSGRK